MTAGRASGSNQTACATDGPTGGPPSSPRLTCTARTVPDGRGGSAQRTRVAEMNVARVVASGGAARAASSRWSSPVAP